jgi:hypothetical protein
MVARERPITSSRPSFDGDGWAWGSGVITEESSACSDSGFRRTAPDLRKVLSPSGYLSLANR